MLIKQSGLNFNLGKKFPALFFLTGQEPYQLNKFAEHIKLMWATQHETELDGKTIYISSASDWTSLNDEANSYSLFSSKVFIDVRFDKKSLDAPAKAFLEQYLKHPNTECLIVFRTPELTLKALQSFTNHEAVHVIAIGKPDKATTIKWINEQLNKSYQHVDPEIAGIIYQYNESNLLGCAQLVDKLAIIAEPDERLTMDSVQDHLVNQCNYSLFELADACLNGDQIKAIQLLRQSQGNKTEPTLILWLLTQEIRLLMQLCNLSKQMPIRDAASQLKIWAQRIRLYQQAVTRFDAELLSHLLRYCNKLDMGIKTGQTKQIWQSFEQLAMSVCTGKQVGCFA